MSINPEDKTSLSPLLPKIGDIRDTKKAVTGNLIALSETEDKKLTADQKLLLAQFVDMTSKGFVGNMSMICEGARCPYITACPLHAVGAALPVGAKCPVENSIVALWINKHLKSLGIEDPDDPVHSFDMDMLYELAGQELIRHRCSIHLSNDPRLVSNQQIGATQQGEPIFGDVINPILDVMERAGRNISKIREALVATREAQVKAGQSSIDPTQKAADLREKANKIIEARRKPKEDIKQADFKVKDEQSK